MNSEFPTSTKNSEISAFLSHSSADSEFVLQVAGYLGRCFGQMFCYEENQNKGDYVARMQKQLDASNLVVFFVGAETSTSKWQQKEMSATVTADIDCIPVLLPNAEGKATSIPPYAEFQNANIAIQPGTIAPTCARDTAIKICNHVGVEWLGKDGLPAEPNLFHYEKEIIRFFQDLLSHKDELNTEKMNPFRDKILKGCPMNWPTVARRSEMNSLRNPLIPTVGKERKDEDHVLVSALRAKEGSHQHALGFPEAGPRRNICFPINEKGLKVAILVVGGIAPGINAVIDGIVQRHSLHAKKGKYAEELEVHGLINGVHAFDDLDNSHHLLVSDLRSLAGHQLRLETPPHVHEGGSILGTCRDDMLMKEPDRDRKLKDIVSQLRNFDILYVIGGDGGMRLAHAIRNYALAEGRTGKRELSIVAIPKTMDNDILWVWQSFGFMSAVEKAREVIEHIHTEITSNPRLGIVQLFGSISGFVVSHAVLAGSTPNCYLALVPEVPFSLKKVATYLKKRLKTKKGSAIPGGLIVMAETALPTDALQILRELDKLSSEKSGKEEPVLSKKEAEAVKTFLALQEEHKTLSGQTSDALRSACLKIVSRGLEHLLKKNTGEGSQWQKLRVVTNEPRHIIRAIPPSCQDIITGRRLGSLAVDNAMAGYTDFMLSQWLTEFVLVPLPLVVLGRKQIHKEGIFWKSVLAKTGSWDCFKVESLKH